MKMTDAVNSIPADTDNTQWPEVLADAVPYMKEMSKPYMWAAGLEADPDYKEQIQSELLKLTRLEETSDEFIENLSNRSKKKAVQHYENIGLVLLALSF